MLLNRGLLILTDCFQNIEIQAYVRTKINTEIRVQPSSGRGIKNPSSFLMWSDPHCISPGLLQNGYTPCGDFGRGDAIGRMDRYTESLNSPGDIISLIFFLLNFSPIFRFLKLNCKFSTAEIRKYSVDSKLPHTGDIIQQIIKSVIQLCTVWLWIQLVLS